MPLSRMNFRHASASKPAVHIFRSWAPHRWLILLGGSLIAMALFSPYVSAYGAWFGSNLPTGAEYRVNPPFPEAFLDLRRFVAYSGVPIYWIWVTLFFVSFFRFPAYLVVQPLTAHDPELAFVPAPSEPETTNEYGLPLRSGFRALLPYHLGDDLVSLSSEDHYIRVVTDRGNALVRYRFADAIKELSGIMGIQVHRSHWVAVRAVERVSSDGKGYRIRLTDGNEFPVSRTNVGVIRAAGLLAG